VVESDCDLRVRVVRIATGAHLLSLADGDSTCPSLRETLDRLPLGSDLVLNVDGAREPELRKVIVCLQASPRIRDRPRPAMVVCRETSARSLFELPGLTRVILLEHSLQDALPYLLGRTWLEALVDTPAGQGRDR
jgi:hypothetical protein